MAFLDFYGNSPGYGNRRGGGSPASVPFASVAANGWQVDYAATPPASPQQDFVVSRAGYDGTGTATIHSETLRVTERVRRAFPNHATLSPLTAALSDYLYMTDSVSGATNAATEISPRPVAQWAMPDRRVVGNTLIVEIVAFHRNGRDGKPVACVTGTASDGTSTVTASSAVPIILGHSGDRNPVIGYRLTFDLAPLSDNANIAVNARVFPWIGGAASVLDSAATGVAVDGRGFGPQMYRRDITKVASPPYAYVDATGGVDATVNSSGVATTGTDSGQTKIATSAATASARPFQTLQSAIVALKAASGVTGGFTTGCVIRIKAAGGTLALGTTAVAFNSYQNGGEVIIESDPAGGVAAISWGTAISMGTQPYLRLRNLNLTRTGSVTLPSGGTGTKWVLENVALDAGASSVALTSGANCAYLLGVTLSNTGSGNGTVLAPGSAAPNTANGIRLLRGVQCISPIVADMHVVLGCRFSANCIRKADTGRHPDGTVIAFNQFYAITGGSIPLAFASTGAGSELAALGLTAPTPFTGIAIVQNLFEKIDTVNTATLRPSGDSDGAHMIHLIMWNNSFAGAGLYGRGNILYDDASYVRQHRLHSLRGNIHVQLNTKGDVFVGANGNGTPNPVDAPNHVGNWPYSHGVGCVGEFSQWIDAGAGEFEQDFPGVKADIGTSASVWHNPLFTANAATMAGPVAGAGGGDYTLQPASPCIGVLSGTEEVLPVDLAGVARNRGSIGAYR